MRLTISPLAAASVAALFALAACKKSQRTADSATAMTAAGADTTAAPAADTAAGGLTDANIVYILDQANVAESARGVLAESKATSSRVKDFGKLMVGEHHALRVQGQQLAKKLGLTPAAPAGDQSEQQAKAEMDSLNATPKGKAWDKSYIDYEVTYHQAVIATATKALDAAKNPELKDLIKKAAPVLQHHLERAQAIQKQIIS